MSNHYGPIADRSCHPDLRCRSVATACMRRGGRAGPGQAAARESGGRRYAPTALRCSVSWPAAQLASLTSFATLEQRRRVRSRSALRARPRALRCSAPPTRAAACPGPTRRQRSWSSSYSTARVQRWRPVRQVGCLATDFSMRAPGSPPAAPPRPSDAGLTSRQRTPNDRSAQGRKQPSQARMADRLARSGVTPPAAAAARSAPPTPRRG